MRSYVAAIARFFGSARLAVDLLTDGEYDEISREATQWYYDEINIYPINEQLSLLDIP